jgi:hypothetical protein
MEQTRPQKGLTPMTPEQSKDMELWREALARRSDAMERRLDTFEGKLDENTLATQEVQTNTKAMVDMFRSWQGAMRVLEMVGRLAKPLGAILGAIAAGGAAWWALWPTKK